MMSLGRVAIVTGAGSGVGRASALALLRDGYSVALAGRRIDTLESTLEAAGAESEEHRSRAIAVATDVGSPDSVAALFARTRNAFGGAAGRAVQQRRQFLATGEHGGPDLRAVDDRGQRQPDRHLPLYPGGHQDNERPGPQGRAHHQQRIHRCLCAKAQ